MQNIHTGAYAKSNKKFSNIRKFERVHKHKEALKDVPFAQEILIFI